MTSAELLEWMNESILVHSDEEVDKCSNRYETRIYQRGQQYFRVEYCNGYPISKDGEILGFAEPVEVFKREVEVIETFYLSKEELD